jgi:C-terminal processing protease CtpA/Prc
MGLLLAGGLVSAAFAGGAGYKCTKTTDECLNAMVGDMKTRGWIGCELDKDETGALVVKRVVAGTPAEAAGIQVGDQFIAMNGIKLGDEKNMEALYAAKKSQKVGSEIRYTVSRKGAVKEVAVKLAPVPEDVLAQWVGQHMLEHSNTAIARN